MEGIIENENASCYLHGKARLAEFYAGSEHGELNDAEGTLTLVLRDFHIRYRRLPETMAEHIGKRVTFDLSDEPGKPVRWWVADAS